MMATDTWCSTFMKFGFLLVMLAMMVWCCSGCTQQPTPAHVDKIQLKQHTNAAMAEETARINAEMERRWRK